MLDFSDIDRQNPEEQQVDLRWAYMNWLQVGNLVIMPEFSQTPLSNDYARKFVSNVFKEAGTDAVIESIEATELVKLADVSTALHGL